MALDWPTAFFDSVLVVCVTIGVVAYFYLHRRYR